ncbi:MAG: FtsK/SpoIIIE domain-containing protein [Bryobacteraceae bacterium]
MPVELHVRQVRGEILRAAGGPVYGLPDSSSRMVGTLFHEIFADLLGPEPRLHARAALVGGSATAEEWNARLCDHIYRLLLGPRIEANHAALQTATREVLDLWKSLEELAQWLTGILHEAWRRGAFSVSADSGSADLSISAEEPLSWRLREPGWTDSVQISGVPDAVFRLPGGDRWCVAELKTGQSAPEADLAQACLYHQMLAAGERTPGSLALIRFHPQLEQKVFAPRELKPVEARLKALIGRLAGVLPGPRPATPSRPAVAEPAPAKLEYAELGRRLAAVFREYSSPVEMLSGPIVGPTFLRFPVQPARSVRPESVRKLAGAVQVRLELEAPPFIHTAGTRLVVDVARPDREPVLFAAVRGQLPEADPVLGCSKLPVGLDLEGNLRMADLADSADCHLLVAGATGSGKSEWLRAMIAGLLLTNAPETLQFLLVDPKRNAFNELAGSPYLWGDRRIVYPDEVNPIDFFDRLVEEMEGRYRAFQAAGVDHLAELQQSGGRLPRIVCVCEEYADLLFCGRKEIEERIRRLGQKARAAGIHLVLAVQQPSREIVKGALQANIPARVGLRVTSRIESKMLLDRSGAEDLLGNGDLLFKDIGEPVRLQGLYLPPGERRTIFGGAAFGRSG